MSLYDRNFILFYKVYKPVKSIWATKTKTAVISCNTVFTFKYIQTNSSQSVYVWMVDLRNETHYWIKYFSYKSILNEKK